MNPRQYLNVLHPGEKFYVAKQLSSDDYSKLEFYGIYPSSSPQIPIPRFSATNQNANGKQKVRKDLPKELRVFEHEYHIVDWHGNDHYGTCWQKRWCYQRELIPPTEIAFVIKDGTLYSPLMANSENEYLNIRAAINIVLEMLGCCELLTADYSPVIPPIKQKCVPWEILRAGNRFQSGWEEYMDKIVEHKPTKQKTIIRKRHEHLWRMTPDFCVLGTNNFWGYVGYGFTSKNLFIFECNDINNATYIFKGNWESASQLTKTEVLSGHIQEARIYHTESWYEHVQQIVGDSIRRGSNG